jgi:hypothetical protein
MNQRQPVWPIAVMLIAGVTFGIITIRSHHREFINTSLRAMGSNLIASANSSYLVSVDPDLSTQLTALRSTRTQIADVLFGDEQPPVGDGSAACRLVLTNDAGKGLLIRLRLADKTGRFQVLGFRMISE